MLLEHLTIEPAWLDARLDFPRPHEYAAEGATQLLWIVRRYCAKLLYELEFHAADDVTTMRVALRRAARRRAQGDAERRRTTSPTSTTASTSSQYLRAWAFEAQLRAYLREKFGNDVVHAARRGLAPPRALVGGPEADRGRAPRARSPARRLELEAVAERVRESLAAV